MNQGLDADSPLPLLGRYIENFGGTEENLGVRAEFRAE